MLEEKTIDEVKNAKVLSLNAEYDPVPDKVDDNDLLIIRFSSENADHYLFLGQIAGMKAGNEKPFVAAVAVGDYPVDPTISKCFEMVICVSYDCEAEQAVQDLIVNKNYISDGIINPVKYAAAKPKILWILKGAKSVEESYIWDFRGYLGWNLDGCSLNWKNQFSAVIRTSYGLINDVHDIWKIRQISDFSKDEVNKTMQSIAVINIKKNPETRNLGLEEVRKEYLVKRDFIKEQISLIDPDIIINCSGVQECYEDCRRSGKFKVVNADNPAQFRITKNEYCGNIFAKLMHLNK